MMDNALRAECASLANPDAAAAAHVQSRHAALGLPDLQGADHRAAEHPGGELARAGAQVRQLQGADQRALSAGRAVHRPRCRGSSPGTSATAALALAALLFTWFLIALTMIDFDTQCLPDQLTYPLLWLGLLAQPVAPGVGRRAPRRSRRADSIIGAMCGYLSSVERLLGLQADHGQGRHGLRRLQAVRRLRRLVGLAACCCPSSCSPRSSARWSASSSSIRQRKGMDTPIAFGPFLAVAGWLFLLFGHEIVERYLGLFAQPR